MAVATEQASVRAQTAVDALLRAGVTHVVWLVDTETSGLYEALRAAADGGRGITLRLASSGASSPSGATRFRPATCPGLAHAAPGPR